MVPIEVRRVGSVGVARDGVRVEFVAGVEIVALGIGDSVVIESVAYWIDSVVNLIMIMIIEKLRGIR